jgi:hypothetical protein
MGSSGSSLATSPRSAANTWPPAAHTRARMASWTVRLRASRSRRATASARPPPRSRSGSGLLVRPHAPRPRGGLAGPASVSYVAGVAGPVSAKTWFSAPQLGHRSRYWPPARPVMLGFDGPNGSHSASMAAHVGHTRLERSPGAAALATSIQRSRSDVPCWPLATCTLSTGVRVQLSLFSGHASVSKVSPERLLTWSATRFGVG